MSTKERAFNAWRSYCALIRDAWFDREIPHIGRLVATSIVAFTLVAVSSCVLCVLINPVVCVAVSALALLSYFIARRIAGHTED